MIRLPPPLILHKSIWVAQASLGKLPVNFVFLSISLSEPNLVRQRETVQNLRQNHNIGLCVIPKTTDSEERGSRPLGGATTLLKIAKTSSRTESMHPNDHHVPDDTHSKIPAAS